MWSGSSLHNKSGNLLGAHQKFDRVAAKFVHEVHKGSFFPTGKEILHFEGKNGPDGIKVKSPGRDEPWHYWDPTDENDQTLLRIINMHYQELVEALRTKDKEKSAFEAAWLAHAVVDGMTPAHHYPYEKKLMEIRGGETKETRDTIRKKLIIKGDSHRQTISKNWQFWGPRGLYASHFMFEGGVSTISRPLSLKKAMPIRPDIIHARNVGIDGYMKEVTKQIYNLNMYERFLKKGWTPSLAKDVRLHLAPTITKTIAVLWIMAIEEADE